MNPAIASDLQEWKEVLLRELIVLATEMRKDEDIYGFALRIPEDIAAPEVCAAVNRESNLRGESRGSLTWLERRYCPNEWEALPNAKFLGESCRRLAATYDAHRNALLDPSFEYTSEGLEYRERVFSLCLDAMARCHVDGAFGHIWYKVLWISDAEHPVVSESFYRLNSGRALEEAARLFPKS